MKMDHTLDLTQGNIYQELCLLMPPLLLWNILQQLYNAADAWIIGRYVGQIAFAAVGVSGTVMNLFIFLLSGCCAGFSILFAQFFVAGDWRSFRRESYLSIVYGGAMTVGLSILALAGLRPILRIIQTPSDVVTNGIAYMRTIAMFYVLCFVGSAFVGWFRGVGLIRIPIFGTCLQISMRVILSRMLVQKLGLYAVALATDIGWVGVVIFHFSAWRLNSIRETSLIAVSPYGSIA